jgi:DNA-binding transcriptional LysR family regulator
LLTLPTFEPATTTRRFRIATTDYAEFLLLPTFLGTLATHAPRLDVWIRPFADDPLGALQRGELDLAIGIVGPDGGGPNAQMGHLLDDRLVCVVRDGHPLTRGRLTLARFAAANHVLIAPRGQPGGLVDDALAARGFERHVAVAVPHFLAAPHIVAETDLVLTVAARIAASFATVLPVRILELPFDLPIVRVWMQWHERHDDDPAHLWFRSRLAKIAGSIQAPHRWNKRRAPTPRGRSIGRKK